MNTHALKNIGIIATKSLLVVSLLMPVAAFAQSAHPAATTPTPQTSGTQNTSATQPATTVTSPNGTTKAGTTNTAANTPATATGNGTDNQSAGSDGTFTALTQLPGISSISSASSFSDFLNTLYKICIGAGAVIAVLMIMYAGVLFMTSSGSVTSNEKAKNYIQNALLGLVLVLTPTIVFGIINPSILNINIGAEFAQLQTQLHSLDTGSNTDAVDVSASVLKSCNITPTTQQKSCIDNATSKVYQDYNNCVANNVYLNKGNTDCTALIKSEAPNLTTSCISTATSQQQSCMGQQWASAIQNNLDQKTNSGGGCTVYDQFKTISGGKNDDGSDLSCGVGWQRITNPAQCSQSGGCNVTARGQACCGHLPQTEYLLAYHYTRASKASNTSCIAYDTPKYFSTQDSCSQMLSSLNTTLPAVNGSSNVSNIVIDKSCVQVSNQSYTPPADPKACKTN